MTLSSQACLSTAAFSASPFRFLFAFDPTVGLHDFQRIGRGRQHIGEQFVRIERDRRDQRLELLGLEQFGLWLGWGCAAGAAAGWRGGGWLGLCGLIVLVCAIAASGRRDQSASASKILPQPTIVASIPMSGCTIPWPDMPEV